MKKGLKKPMNKQDKQDLELILYRLNEQDKSVQKLEKHFNQKYFIPSIEKKNIRLW